MNNNIPQGYKESPLGVIPQDWEVRRLGEVCNRIGDGIHGTPHYVDYSDYVFINGNNLVAGKIKIGDDAKFVSKEEYDQNNKNLDSETILLSINGTIGNIALYNGEKVMLGKSAAYLKFKESVLFYFQLMQSEKIQNVFTKELSGSTIKNLSLKSIREASFALPPIAEQERIAEVLGCWDMAIEKQAALVDALTRRKRALMQQLLTARRRLPNFTTPWQTVKLGEIGDTYNGLTGKTKNDFGDGCPYISYMNVFGSSKINIKALEYVKIGANENQNKVKYGDVFFTVSSETPEEVGMSSVLLDDIQNTYLNSFCFGYRLFNFNTLLPEYAQYYFRSKSFRTEMYKLAQGSTRFNLSKGGVLKLEANLPSIDEQKAIAQILTTADQEIKSAKTKLEALRTQKRGLMQQLLTGKKRLKV